MNSVRAQTMATDFVSYSSQNPPIAYWASSSGAADIADDSFEEACCICLEPFTAADPATVTNCKHEYHLQCIIEWSQRSKECPICCRFLVLKDTASQELLAAVEKERSMRSRDDVQHLHEDHDDAHYSCDSDFEEHIMRHFAAIASRARYITRRRRQRSSGIGSSQILPSVLPADLPNMQQKYDFPEVGKNSGSGFPEAHSPTSGTLSSIMGQTTPSATDVYSASNTSGTLSSIVGQTTPPATGVYSASNTTSSKDGCLQPQCLPSNGPQISSRAELLAFSESVRCRLSAASARYKESISKRTRGFKEKFLACNGSVKELGKGVQREMSVGIVGVAKMIERLDVSLKRAGPSLPLYSVTGGAVNTAHKGKGVQECLAAYSPHGSTGKAAQNMRSGLASSVPNTSPGQFKIPVVQGGSDAMET